MYRFVADQRLWEAREFVPRKAEVTFELQRVFGMFGAKFARLQAQVTARPRLSLHRLVTVKVNHLSMGCVSEQTGQPVGFARSIRLKAFS